MEKIRLGDACEILNGFAFKSENYVDSGIRVIRIANVQKGYIEDNTPAFYPLDSVELDKYMLEEGDLLISLTGNVGRVAILEKEFLPAALNQRVACLRLKTSRLTKGYLFHILNGNLFEQQCIQSSKGVAQKNMSTAWLKNYEIPLYSKEKQDVITEILDKTCNVISCRQQEIQKLDDLIKARFVELFGDPVDNPRNWKKKKLKDIVTEDCTISYGIVQTGEDQKEGVPVFRPVDIVNHIPKVEELKKTTEFISDRYKKTLLKGHELLITVRANIADTFIADEEYKGCNVGRGIVPIRTQEDIIRLEFLKCLIDNKHLNDILKSKAKGITLIQLNMEDLRNIELIIPPIDLQIDYLKYSRLIDKSKFLSNHSLFLLKSITF